MAVYVSALTVAARTLIPAHAHTRLGRWLEATGARGSRSWRAGAAMGEVDAGTPSFEMTWSSTTSSGYCSQEDSDSELEQYFTARTSLARRPRRDQVGAGVLGGGPVMIARPLRLSAELPARVGAQSLSPISGDSIPARGPPAEPCAGLSRLGAGRRGLVVSVTDRLNQGKQLRGLG